MNIVQKRPEKEFFFEWMKIVFFHAVFVCVGPVSPSHQILQQLSKNRIFRCFPGIMDTPGGSRADPPGIFVSLEVLAPDYNIKTIQMPRWIPK